MDKVIPQNIEGIGGNDRCAKTSKGYDKDSSGDKYNNYGNGGNHLES